MDLSASGEGRRSCAPTHEPTPRPAVVWHELECGSYRADLHLWRELAAGAGTVLDVGAGSGRVTLDLAGRGHHVTALDLDAELLHALHQRAAQMRLAERVETVRADARTFAIERSDFGLCIAPMQTLQLLGGAGGRLAFLRRARTHLRPGGVLACAIVTDVEPFDCAAADFGPSPESAQIGARRFVSRATRVHLTAAVVRIERERTILETGPPDGRAGAHASPTCRELDVVELDRLSVAGLEREGSAAGLTPAGARAIAATDEHSGSVAVMFRV